MRKRRAIIFDDESIILRLFKDILSSSDYEVITISEPVVCPMYGKNPGGCSTKELCADVIITDYKMPGMDGVRLLREQAVMGCRVPKENKALMSGFNDEEIQKSVADLGCAFFQKPIFFSDLSPWLAECEKRVDLSRPLATRRSEPRRPTSREIACMVSQNGRLLDGIAINMSDSGVCLELKDPLSTKDPVHIKSGLPNVGCRASVRWIQKEDEDHYLAGLNFFEDS